MRDGDRTLTVLETIMEVSLGLSIDTDGPYASSNKCAIHPSFS